MKRKCCHTHIAQERSPPRPRKRASIVLEDFTGADFSLTIRPRTPVQSTYDLANSLLYEVDQSAMHENYEAAIARAHDDVKEPDDVVVRDIADQDIESLCLHKPQSAENLSVILFAENVQWAGVADSWFGEAPARLGHDSCYDLAIDALMMVCWYGRKLPGATLPKVYRAMATSPELLHLEMG